MFSAMVKRVGSSRLGVGLPHGPSVREVAHGLCTIRSVPKTTAAAKASTLRGPVIQPPIWSTGPSSSSESLGATSKSAVPQRPESGCVSVVGGIRIFLPGKPKSPAVAAQRLQAPIAMAHGSSTSRGSWSAVAAAASSPESMREAVDKLLKDVHSSSSIASRNSLLKTWIKFHDIAHKGVEVPAFPLFEDGILRIAALFKAGGYKSFDNYMDRAKSHHILLGADWSLALDRTSKDARRSVSRNVGRCRQSRPLDILAVGNLPQQDGPFSDGGPIGPVDFAIAGTLFLLREIEIAAARFGSITFGSPEHSAVTWCLPSSKTDCRGVGVSRTLDCTCSIEALNGICPVAALSRQRERVIKMAKARKVDPESLPLFPDSNGNEVNRASAVNTIFSLILASGGKLRDAKGSLLFGGHSLRTGGASLLATLGVHPIRIQAMGRWRSPLVIHYAGEAMATGLVRDMALSANVSSSSTARLAKTENFKNSVNARLQAVAETNPGEEQEPKIGTGSLAQVVSKATQCIHLVPYSPSGLANATLCGWVFPEEAVELLTDNLPHHRECDECYLNLSESD